MRQRLVQSLRSLHAVSVENPVGPGTPDINYVGGWVECKWLRSWPKQAKTPVRLDHELTTQQRVWLRRRFTCGGVAWVILQCGREWLIFQGQVAADILGTSTREELYSFAHKILTGLDGRELIKALTNAT